MVLSILTRRTERPFHLGIMPLCLVISVFATVPGCTGTGKDAESGLRHQALEAYRQTLRIADQQARLDRDAEQLHRVERIAAALIPQTRQLDSSAPNWNWEFHVIESPEINAYCLPGGKVILYSGLFDQLALTDDELAGVLAHEIAHALKHHGFKKTSLRKNLNSLGHVGLSALVLAGAVPPGAINTAISGVREISGSVTSFSYEQSQEYEADRIGLDLVSKSGFNPRGVLSFWAKVSQLQKRPSASTLLQSHPSDKRRLQALESELTDKRINGSRF